jgi:hypothetical protein
VSYQVRFEGGALIQLNGLPPAAFDALVERVVALVDEPWDATVMPPGDDPAYRMTVFGSGNGLMLVPAATPQRSSGSPTSPGSADPPLTHSKTGRSPELETATDRRIFAAPRGRVSAPRRAQISQFGSSPGLAWYRRSGRAPGWLLSFRVLAGRRHSGC